MDEGWLYGEWETGPWWAFHDKVFLLIAIFRPPENERESWSIEQKQEKESGSYLRVKENLDPLKKNTIGDGGSTAARFLIATFNESKSFRFGYNQYKIFPFPIDIKIYLLMKVIVLTILLQLESSM